MARRKSKPASKSKATGKKRGAKPIALYYWPTPDFLKISPNNRMPAIVDPDGPGGRPISIFESGAILQYLGRKAGKFYPADERARVAVDEWLFWQMANLGPKAGEANHFRRYAPEQLPYAIERFSNEMHRLYGVMNTRLKD